MHQIAVHEAGHLDILLQHIFENAEFTLFIPEGGVIALGLADEKLRAAVEEDLVEAIRANDDQNVGLGL
ncbi:MAG: hypothetical protein MO852_10525 [Candidatus Devosia euplotis]|nr:hypothetical protein [Candidatus Devosia euplotis]